MGNTFKNQKIMDDMVVNSLSIGKEYGVFQQLVGQLAWVHIVVLLIVKSRLGFLGKLEIVLGEQKIDVVIKSGSFDLEIYNVANTRAG